MSWILAAAGKTLKILAWCEEAFLCLLLLAMIFLACFQIALRDLFSTGFSWIDPLLRQLLLWSGLFGAALATRRRKHIVIDIASHLLPVRVQPWIDAVLNLLAAIVCGILAYAAIIFILNEAEFSGDRLLLGIASWRFYLAFPAAFILTTVYFLANTGITLAGMAGRRTPPPGRI